MSLGFYTILQFVLGALLGVSISIFAYSNGIRKEVECVRVDKKIYCGRIVDVDDK